MQALMLAAGMGKRLGKYTQNGTKCMVCVNGKSLIEYAIESLQKTGIEKFIIVTGYKSEVLKKFIAEKFPKEKLGNLKISYIENTVYDKTNNIYSLYLARNELAKDDTILLESDIIFDSDIIKKLLKSSDENLAVVSHFERWMDGTCTLLDEANNIVGMIDKAHFRYEDLAQYYKTVNIYKLSKEFSKNYYVPFLEAYQIAFGKNDYYEQVLKVLSFLSNETLKALIVDESSWYEIDDAADLKIAENKFASSKQKLHLMESRYGGYWRFPHMKDFCYLVNPFFPPQKLVDELKSNFKVLLSSYPSGAKEQSLLAGKIFSVSPEYIAVGNGAAELIKAIGEGVSGNALVSFPTFNEYPNRFTNANVCSVEKNNANFSYTIDDIVKTATKQNAKTVLLINPDNPSGQFFEKKEILTLTKKLFEKNITLIYDESFVDFADKDKRFTLIDETILESYNNLIVIKSISKSYGVPGLRLGVLASSNKELISRVQKENSIWNINSFAEYFLQIFDKYKTAYWASCDKIAEERKRFSKRLMQIENLFVFQSQANYVMVRYNGKKSMQAIAENMLSKHNILIKDLSSKKGFDGKKYFRLAILTSDENDKLVECLQKEI